MIQSNTNIEHQRDPLGLDPQLDDLRAKLERIDNALLTLIAKRVSLGSVIGTAKRNAGLPVCDPSREAAVVRRAATFARSAGLEEEGVRNVFWSLIALSRRNQIKAL